ncbi:MAG TPA: hypothetical protein VE270_07400 [Thermoleophilaceae bacterium]|nr:hypothetical protein [Thermoleophilaceae bacterium]
MHSPRRSFVCLALGAFALTATASATPATLADDVRVLERIQELRRETWRWQRLMRVPLIRTTYHAERATPEFRRWALALWRKRAGAARGAAHNPPRRPAWLCIHRHEGPWNARTGNGYYGGLQMDIAFQRRWGPDLLRAKGLAHRWLPIEQIWVAERAYRSGLRFRPWPNTSRACGLV